MVTIYQWIRKEDSHEYAIYCALIPVHKIEYTLSDPADWDLRFYEGTPSAVSVGQFQYLRYGDDNGIEPLVISREFNESQINYGKRTEYSEISEEFRLFHNLYHEKEKNEYIKIDDEGNEHRAAVVEPDYIKIRLKEIRQFLAIKEMYLSIQFRYYEFSKYSLKALGASAVAIYTTLKQQKVQLLTTDYVIDETVTRLRYDWNHSGAVKFLNFIERTKRTTEDAIALTVAEINGVLFQKAGQLFRQYDTAELSFTDCTSFVVCRRRNISEAFAFDQHFLMMGITLRR